MAGGRTATTCPEPRGQAPRPAVVLVAVRACDLRPQRAPEERTGGRAGGGGVGPPRRLVCGASRLAFQPRWVSWGMRGVVHGLPQTAYLITKTDCSRCPKWPLAAITGSFRHPAGVFSCRLGREDRPKLAGACLIRRRCTASPTCLGSASDLYSPGAVRPRYCGILRRLQARVPAYEVSRTGHNSAA